MAINVRPKAREMPRCPTKGPASTAVLRPANTSTRVPNNSARYFIAILRFRQGYLENAPFYMAWFGLENQVYNLAFLRLIRMAVPANAGREWLRGTILRNSQFSGTQALSYVEGSFKGAHSPPRGADAPVGDFPRHA